MERILKSGIVTTILGLSIIIFSAVMIYQGKETASEMMGWVTVGLLFLRSKDSLIGIPKKDE